MSVVDQELKEQFDIQIKLIQSAIRGFDKGNFLEAINLAVRLRVLLHDTNSSKSLLRQMGIKNKLGYYDSSLNRIKNDGFLSGVYVGLMQFVVGNDKVFALLDSSPNTKIIFFDDRWEGKVFIDIDGETLSRKSVILNIANKIGAHVDLDVDASYNSIIKENSLGINIGNSDTGYNPIKKLEYVAIRQIIHELLRSIYKGYRMKYKFTGSGFFMCIN